MAEQKPPQSSPDPSPSPSPGPPPAAASSTDSSRASASRAPLVEDAGPQFDPERAGPPPPAADAPPAAAPPLQEVLPEWEEEAIANLLGIQGRLLHAAVGVAEEEWLYTELDLAAIAPPLVRILNRYEPTRRYATYGDPISLAIGGAGYVTRSLIERRHAIEAGPPPTETPIPPADAPPPQPAAATAEAPPPPPPPPPRAAADLQPPTGRQMAAVPKPPPPPDLPINAGEVEWNRDG